MSGVGRSREALHVLVDGDGSDRAVRTERLETALRDLDRSVITTTQVLRSAVALTWPSCTRIQWPFFAAFP